MKFPAGLSVATTSSSRPHGAWLAGAVIAGATLAAYANSFHGPFVFDDVASIPQNASIRHLGRIAEVLSPPAHDGMTVGGRPFLNLSFALNYAVSGTDVWSYHLLNIVIHVLAGLTLWGIVRRTLALCPGLMRCGTGPGSVSATEGDLIALVVAALWTLHPLQTESVTYMVQRAESLMGLLYLQTLYALIRSIEAPASRIWPAWCIGACLLGMATKEVMVSAPLLMLLYDRTFAAGSFRAAWQLRRRLYVGLAGTWILLGLLVAGTGGNRGGSIGFGVKVGFWDHALTQFGAISRYLWLSLWPHPLVLDYGPERVTRVVAIIPYVLIVGALVWITVRGFRRRTALGFAGVWFFAILAPTSLIPGPTQMTVEHRMYLPLVVVLAALVLAAYRLGGRRILIAGGSVAVIFAGLTFARNGDYRSGLAIWEATVNRRPANPVALAAYGEALYSVDRLQESLANNEKALQVNPGYADAWNNLGVTLVKLGRLPEAVEAYTRSLRERPDRTYVRENRARALQLLGRFEEAAAEYATALKERPESADDHSGLGSMLMQLNRAPEAVDHFAAVLRYRPDDTDAHFNLGNALASSGRFAEAVPHFEKTLVMKPADVEAACNLADALMELKRPAEAVARFEVALAAQPDSPMVLSRYGNALLELGRGQDAIDRVTRAIRRQPQDGNLRLLLADITAQAGGNAQAVALYDAILGSNPERGLALQAHYHLGLVYLQLGEKTKATAEFESALRIDPAFAEARQMLARVRLGP